MHTIKKNLLKYFINDQFYDAGTYKLVYKHDFEKNEKEYTIDLMINELTCKGTGGFLK